MKNPCVKKVKNYLNKMIRNFKLPYLFPIACVLLSSSLGVGVQSREIPAPVPIPVSLVNTTTNNNNITTPASLNVSLSFSTVGNETRQSRVVSMSLDNNNNNPSHSQVGIRGLSDTGKVAVSGQSSGQKELNLNRARSFVPYPLKRQVIYSNGLPYLVYETDLYEPDEDYYEPYYYDGVSQVFEAPQQSVYILREVSDDEEEEAHPKSNSKSTPNPNPNPDVSSNKESQVGPSPSQSDSGRKPETGTGTAQGTRGMRAPVPKISRVASIRVPVPKERFLPMYDPYEGGFGGFGYPPGSYYPHYDYDNYDYGFYPPQNFDHYY